MFLEITTRGLMKSIAAGILVLAALISGCVEERLQGTIVFQSNRDGNFEIYTMNATGGDQRRLTESPANDITPCWSPDGAEIAFASDRDGNWEIYTVRSDGSSLSRLTQGQGANTAPAWTPDGKKILFISTRDVINGDVYQMDRDGGNVLRTTNDSTVKDTPVMLADGKTILATVNTRGRFTIASFSSTGTLAHLTSVDHNSMNPSLSPDGTRVLFASDRDGSGDIYSMAPSGADQTRITVKGSGASSATWTSDKQHILLARRGSIAIFSLKDGKETVISNKGDSAPRWHSRQ